MTDREEDRKISVEQETFVFDAVEIGRRISQARKEAGGLTQEQLGDALGLSKRAIQAYEVGKTIPWKHLHALSEITGKSTAWILRGDSQIVEATVARQLQDQLDHLQADVTTALHDVAATLETVLQIVALLGSNGPVKTKAGA